MSKKKIIFVVTISILTIFILSFLLSVYFLFIHHYKGTVKIDEWHETDQFKIENIVTVNKQNNKDFVILNLADIQMCDLEDIFNMPTIHREITYLVETTKPDLITLTGDQTWSNENLISLKTLIKWLDDYKIPYAPVFGNHDYGNKKNSAVAELNYCCDLYENGKFSLFKRGPSNLGSLGNYVINIMENDKIFKTLYMIDAGYGDIITDEQIAWFKWNADGIKSFNNGIYTQAMCFMHKPIPEFSEAYYKYLQGSSDIEVINDVVVSYSLWGTEQNGFFDIAKACNVTDIVCGHQHGNNFTLKYNNIRLTFALKTGELGGFYSNDEIYLNGATIFNLSDAYVNISNVFVDRNKYKIK